MKKLQKQPKTPPTSHSFRFPLNGGGLKGSKSNNILPKNQLPKNKTFLGFTLVELIVVIVILAILATIAFLSFNSYSSSSRDSVRLSDINSLNKSLELFNISAAKYPDPTNVYMTVVYSGGAIFEQGKLGDSVITAVQKMSKKPVDPLKNTEYTYSVNMSNTAFQLKANLEGKLSTGYNDGNENSIPHLTSPNTGEELMSSIFPLNKGDMRGIIGMTNQVNADINSGSTVCYIKGNFNGLIEKTNTGNTNYILAVPGLVLTDSGTNQVGNTNIDYSTLSGKVICNGLNDPCVINYTPSVVFIGSGNTLPSTIGDVGAVVGGLKTAYSGSNVSNTNSTISNILTSTGTNMLSLGATVVGKVGATSVNSLSTNTTYPGCNTSDIILDNGQVWSACNVGANVAFTGVNPAAACTVNPGCASDPYSSRHATTGNYYQWGRNKDVTSVATIGGPRIDNTNLFIANSTISPFNWYNSIDNNLWGGSVNDTINIDGQLDKTLRKGPCASGYHVPSIREWWNTILYLEPTSTYVIGWTPNSTLISKLRLPLAGNRYIDGNYYYQGFNSYYHSSSPSGNNIADLLINIGQIQTNHYSYRAYGSVVRCIKN